MPGYPVHFAFPCLSSKIDEHTVQAMDRFEDTDGSFDLGTAPQGRVLEASYAPGSHVSGDSWGILLLPGASQGLWLHARSLCWSLDETKPDQHSLGWD